MSIVVDGVANGTRLSLPAVVGAAFIIASFSLLVTPPQRLASLTTAAANHACGSHSAPAGTAVPRRTWAGPLRSVPSKGALES